MGVGLGPSRGRGLEHARLRKQGACGLVGLAETPADLAELRRRRPEAVANAEASFKVLFESTLLNDALPSAYRYAVAAFIAGVSGQARGRSAGPYAGGDFITFEGAGGSGEAGAVGEGAGGTGADGVGAADGAGGTQPGAAKPQPGVSDPGWKPAPQTLVPDVVAPGKFVNHSLGWKPWVAPLAKEELTDAQREALIKPERADQEYFRLLARDPEALKARTLTDLDIFYNTDGGLGRAERELAAAVVSRLNGCDYCASVHQARSKEEGGDAAVIDRLLGEGVAADLGTEAWNAIRDAAVALTRTPNAFGPREVAGLRQAGLDDLAVIDVINASSFFNWANRLMLTLGEPDVRR